MSRNFAVLLTPPGAAAIAVLRLRGTGVGPFLQAHFRGTPRIGRCVHGELFDETGVIDDPVVVLSDDGRCADVNLHGGSWIVRRALELAGREGFEVLPSAAPVPAEAVDADSELEREVLTHLPLAATELGVRALLAQTRAWADFKRICAAEPERARESIRQILNDRTLRHLLYPATVAIVGAPNVGKSTLANQLFAQERSITADVPGTTRDWVGEIANLDGLPVMLIDTPGRRDTPDPIERAAIERSREPVAKAELVIVVLDATQPLRPGQAPMLDEFADAIVVVNKCDRPRVLEESESFERRTVLRTVSRTGAGVDGVRRAVTQTLCGEFPIDPSRPRVWTPRQQSILMEALADLSATDAI